MNRIDITSHEWTEVIPSGGATDMILQSVDGFVAATGGEPSDFVGISLAPFEKWIVPAGVQVWGRSSGAADSAVIIGVFGA